MDITARIGDIRRHKGVTQKALADQLGMDQGNYSKLEKRGVKMTLEQLQSIADALEVSVVELIGGEVKADAGQFERLEAIQKENEDLKRINDGYKLLYTESSDKLKRLYADKINSIQEVIIHTALENKIMSDGKYKEWLHIYYSDDGPSFFVKNATVEAKNLDPNGFILSHFMSESEIYKCLCIRSEVILNDLGMLDNHNLITDKGLKLAFDKLKIRMDSVRNYEDNMDLSI